MSYQVVFDIIVGIVILLFATKGSKKGFLKMVVPFLVFILSMFFCNYMKEPITRMVDENITETVQVYVDTFWESNPIEGMNTFEVFIENSPFGGIGESVKEVIDGIYETSKDVLIKNIVTFVLFIISFSVLSLVLRKAFYSFINVIYAIPFAKSLDRAGGALMGALRFVVIIWCVASCAFLLVSMGSKEASAILSIINQSVILKGINRYNVIANLFFV